MLKVSVGKIELTDNERGFLATHARYEANNHLDYRYYQDLSHEERWDGYDRWMDIADALHTNPWHSPNYQRRVRPSAEPGKEES